MTVREFIIKHLTDNGLRESEAKRVMTDVVEEDAFGDRWMLRRWDEDITVSAYPLTLLAVMLKGVNRLALKWIHANAPLHSARKAFCCEDETK